MEPVAMTAHDNVIKIQSGGADNWAAAAWRKAIQKIQRLTIMDVRKKMNDQAKEKKASLRKVGLTYRPRLLRLLQYWDV